jgi:hypothetical protein
MTKKSPPRSEKCCWSGDPPSGLGVSPSEAPFQDRGARRAGWVDLRNSPTCHDWLWRVLLATFDRVQHSDFNATFDRVQHSTFEDEIEDGTHPALRAPLRGGDFFEGSIDSII